MNKLQNRCEVLAQYLCENNSTVRKTAEYFGISKSTVHKDIRSRLINVNYPLYMRAVSVLETNKNERHIRGGLATKHKYEFRKYRSI